MGLTLSACGEVYTVSDSSANVTSYNQFAALEGNKLGYQLYLPSQLNDWVHDERYQFIYDPKQQVYWLKNIPVELIGGEPKVLHFKISNFDWHHQFGFGKARINADDSVYSVPSDDGIVFQLVYSNNATNLTLELPEESDAKFVSFAIKVVDNNLEPQALLYTKLTTQLMP